MNIFYISIFPEIFESFLTTSLVQKSVEKWILRFEVINPRTFCLDKQKQVDDEIYWGGSGLLLKAQPFLEAIETAIKKTSWSYKIVIVQPSEHVFDQRMAVNFSNYQNLIFVCGRYEWFDTRLIDYLEETYSENVLSVSLGKFVTLGGEAPAMVATEAIIRLLPGVINDLYSTVEESYHVDNIDSLEYPQYTRPQERKWKKVPDVLLSGNHKLIQERRRQHRKKI